MGFWKNSKEERGLYQSANSSSIKKQRTYFNGILIYIILLIVATLFACVSDNTPSAFYKIILAILFLGSLIIMIWLRVSKPNDIWYNARAVAESVKTRAWRWMLRAKPYEDIEIMHKKFIKDLEAILEQNKSLIGKLSLAVVKEPISEQMKKVRRLPIDKRIKIYEKERITNQSLWYSKKVKFNKNKSKMYFVITVILHGIAIILLLYNIKEPLLKMPIETITVAASGLLTWSQAKKHNELSSSYSLTVHEIMLIKSETTRINTELELSEYILNCENAFSREHTQWVTRKNEQPSC